MAQPPSEETLQRVAQMKRYVEDRMNNKVKEAQEREKRRTQLEENLNEISLDEDKQNK